ncbi:MAG: response regulator [Deltaproteobacteria bacterium]|nr:response regulator [Deltaproteobacteria bacterium]
MGDSRRILVVDDDPVLLQLVTSMLERIGHTVFTAENGRQGLDRAQAERPDLIIADVLMPVMDGWDLVEQLRCSEHLMLTPIIFLTALDGDEDRHRGYRLGAEAFLTKPFRLEDLEQRIQEVLSKSVALSGKLDMLPLSTVLTVLEIERKSGVLTAHNDSKGLIFLSDGHVLDASLQGFADPREAVFEMLSWKCGEFKVDFKTVDVPDRIQTSVPHLVLEAARREDARAMD